jgi:hypothetical protein
LGMGVAKISLSYLTVLLWGTLDHAYFNFGPLWGGYLNPLLGSVFLLGLVELFRLRRHPLFYWGGASFLLCLAPGFFSNTLEMMRILSILPLCSVLACWGLWRLLAGFPPARRKYFLALFFAISLGLDLHHLWGPYHRWALPDKYSAGSKCPEHFQAFQILKEIARVKGPFLLFSDLCDDVFDQSLYVTAYGFNAAVNPRLSANEAKWAAVLLEAKDLTVFNREFPRAVYCNISRGLRPPRSAMSMALLEVTDENRGQFLQWVKVQKAIQNLYPDIPHHVARPSYDRLLSGLWGAYRSASGDPYLEYCVLGQIFFYLYESGGVQGAGPLLDLPVKDILVPDILKRQYGFVFHRLGKYELRSGNYQGARKAFLRAYHCDPGYPLSKALDLLKGLGKAPGSIPGNSRATGAGKGTVPYSGQA